MFQTLLLCARHQTLHSMQDTHTDYWHTHCLQDTLTVYQTLPLSVIIHFISMFLTLPHIQTLHCVPDTASIYQRLSLCSRHFHCVPDIIIMYQRLSLCSRHSHCVPDILIMYQRLPLCTSHSYCARHSLCTRDSHYLPVTPLCKIISLSTRHSICASHSVCTIHRHCVSVAPTVPDILNCVRDTPRVQDTHCLPKISIHSIPNTSIIYKTLPLYTKHSHFV